jgi:hypothetical protein
MEMMMGDVMTANHNLQHVRFQSDRHDEPTSTESTLSTVEKCTVELSTRPPHRV